MDGNVARSLGSVHEEVNPMVVEDLPDRLYLLDGPEHIAALGHDHEPGVGPDGRNDRIGMDGTSFEGKDAQADPVLLFIFGERPEDGVVFQGRGQDVAAILLPGEKTGYDDI